MSESQPFQDHLSTVQKVAFNVETKLSEAAVRYKNATPITRFLKDRFIDNHSRAKSTSEEDSDSHEWIQFATQELGTTPEEIKSYLAEYNSEVLPFLNRQQEKVLQQNPNNPLYGKMHKLDMWYALIRARKPSKIVETGLGQGASAIAALLALEKNAQDGSELGKLWTVSFPDQEYENSDGSLIRYDPDWETRWKNWHLVEGDSLEKLPPLLQELGNIDMFLHDSNHTLAHMIGEFNLAFPSLTDKGILASDDAQIPIPFSKPFNRFCNTLQIPHIIESNFGFGIVHKESENQQDS